MNLYKWMLALRDRMRHVRVCCGDWVRVCTNGATAHGKTVGVFLDPPYSVEANRKKNLYRVEDLAIAHRVHEWCVERTENQRYKIALCGYEGEHDDLENIGWDVYSWKAHGGYANSSKDDNAQGKKNKARERIWFSPSCGFKLKENTGLFDA